MVSRTNNELKEFTQEIDRAWKLSLNEMQYLEDLLSSFLNNKSEQR